jgi:glycosyltransferase involved in cell wall biosynthesis
MKVSVIIPTYNSEKYIASALDSVLFQTYQDIECVIMDGGSQDSTLNIIRKYQEQYKNKIMFSSEKDKGVFDALNKGIKKSTGQIIGWMGSDDFYPSNSVIEKAVNIIDNEKVEICWGDLLYVDRDNTSKVLRNWESSQYKKGMFQNGWQLPHFTSFVKRDVFDRLGYFNLEFKIAADYDLFLRFLEKNSIKSSYIKEVLLKMRTGGQSNNTITNIIKGNLECIRAWKMNNLRANFLRLFFKKIISKIRQYIS